MLLENAPVNEVALKEADLREDFYRARGPGGQHRNVTDTAVRLTHIPSGQVVVAERSRSRAQNRDLARAELKRRLISQDSAAREDATREARRSQVTGPERPSKGWTWNTQRDEVIEHASNKRYSLAQAERGRF